MAVHKRKIRLTDFEQFELLSQAIKIIFGIILGISVIYLLIRVAVNTGGVW